jgi:hypothetical protein
MAQELVELPVRTTALLSGPVMEDRPNRDAVGPYSSRSRTRTTGAQLAVVEETQTYRVTYFRARADSMLVAMGRVADLGATSWRQEVEDSLASHGGGHRDLRHLAINFDDGPPYELVSRAFVSNEELHSASRLRGAGPNVGSR